MPHEGMSLGKFGVVRLARTPSGEDGWTGEAKTREILSNRIRKAAQARVSMLKECIEVLDLVKAVVRVVVTTVFVGRGEEADALNDRSTFAPEALELGKDHAVRCVCRCKSGVRSRRRHLRR